MKLHLTITEIRAFANLTNESLEKESLTYDLKGVLLDDNQSYQNAYQELINENNTYKIEHKLKFYEEVALVRLNLEEAKKNKATIKTFKRDFTNSEIQKEKDKLYNLNKREIFSFSASPTYYNKNRFLSFSSDQSKLTDQLTGTSVKQNLTY